MCSPMHYNGKMVSIYDLYSLILFGLHADVIKTFLKNWIFLSFLFNFCFILFAWLVYFLSFLFIFWQYFGYIHLQKFPKSSDDCSQLREAVLIKVSVEWEYISQIYCYFFFFFFVLFMVQLVDYFFSFLLSHPLLILGVRSWAGEIYIPTVTFCQALANIHLQIGIFSGSNFVSADYWTFKR